MADGSHEIEVIQVVPGDKLSDPTKAGDVVSFQVGDIVNFKLDGTTYSAAVAADGTWSMEVPGSKLVAEGPGQPASVSGACRDGAQGAAGAGRPEPVGASQRLRQQRASSALRYPAQRREHRL